MRPPRRGAAWPTWSTRECRPTSNRPTVRTSSRPLVRPLGVIPAGAGSRRTRLRHRRRTRGHPRGCGEQRAPNLFATASLGASPRVRGADVGYHPQGHRKGVIPAGAGSRGRKSCCGGCGWGHPRGCGEQSRMSVSPAKIEGSSPRARGAIVAQAVVPGSGMVIPACAGSRGTSSLVPRSQWGHPRLRGEQSCLSTPTSYHLGPSPLARGADAAGEIGSHDGGAIPACAGSSLNDLPL